MKWTPEQYAEYKAGHPELYPAVKERTEGMPLERVAQREEAGSIGAPERIKIIYRIFAVRPLDYDNWWTKCLTDCIVKAGWLDGDKWDALYGETISEKVHRKEEERTEVEIIYP